MTKRTEGLLVSLLLVGLLSILGIGASECDLAETIPIDVVRMKADVASLVGTVSDAVWQVQGEDGWMGIESTQWILLPSVRTIIGRANLSGESIDVLMTNLSDVLVRVGDLARAMLGDWSLAFTMEDYADGIDYAMGSISIAPSEDGATLVAGEPVVPIEGRSKNVAKALDLIAQILITLDPSELGDVEEIAYIPGVGAFLAYDFYASTPPRELDNCSKWMTFVHNGLSRVGDLLFAVLEEGETLTIATGSLGFTKGRLYFTITSETVDNPEEWAVYLVGVW